VTSLDRLEKRLVVTRGIERRFAQSIRDSEVPRFMLQPNPHTSVSMRWIVWDRLPVTQQIKNVVMGEMNQ